MSWSHVYGAREITLPDGAVTLKVLFLHGFESGPQGLKPKFLRSQGHEVHAPRLPKRSFADSVRIAQSKVDEVKPDYIVGSSRGGAVAMSINPHDAKLVLIAPAWKKYNVSPNLPANAVILHSADDDIVPLKDSFGLPAQLYVCGDDHRMNDEGALYNLETALRT